MVPSTPRLRVLSVGGNALSAFLSWRLQATQTCDVTLVWKASFEAVSQYGISFKSAKFGNERFKPHSVVRSPEEAGTMAGGFDYVLLSVKALPDVYDLASIIESVVTPQHTCILVNTTTALGTEAYLETRFPTNAVLSLVSGVSLNQLGTSEFEHVGGVDIWVGSAISNANIPESIELDMAEALSLTLASGNVECHVSRNIRQQQWERVLGSIAFHPLSVIMDTSSLTALMDKPGCKQLINDLIDELLSIAKAQNCTFPSDFKEKAIEEQLKAQPVTNIMHQDFVSRRPMEVESFIGAPMKFAKGLGINTPHLNTLYPILHSLNQQNQNKPPPASPSASVDPSPRSTQGPPPFPRQGMPPPPGPSQGMPPRRPPPAGGRGPMDPNMGRRPPPPRGPPNGHLSQMNGGYGPRGSSNAVSRRNSFDDDLEEFGHIALYGDLADGDGAQDGAYPAPGRPSGTELALRQQAQQAQGMRAPMPKGGRRKFMPSRSRNAYMEEEDDDDDYYADQPPPQMPLVDVDNFDMMSVTSRRNRRLPSDGNMRNHMTDAPMAPQRGRRSLFNRPPNSRNRASARLLNDVPALNDPLSDSSLMGYSSNRYGTVDRATVTANSRANSMTSHRGGDDIRNDPMFSGGAYPPLAATGRRMSNSPGDRSRPDGFPPRGGPGGPYPDPRAYRGPPNGIPNGNSNGIPNGPPNGHMQQPAIRNLPQQVEQQMTNGVSYPHMMKGLPNNNVRSTTGSASASNDSASASTGGDSAYSSTSSLEKRVPGVAVR